MLIFTDFQLSFRSFSGSENDIEEERVEQHFQITLEHRRVVGCLIIEKRARRTQETCDLILSSRYLIVG